MEHRTQEHRTRLPVARLRTFEEDFGAAARSLRAALITGLAQAGASADRPQETARLLRLDKSFAWRLSKIATEPDPNSWVQHVPGKPGLKILLQALESGGVGPQALEELRDAAQEFERMVETHAGDRTTLGIVVSGLDPNAQADGLVQSRKLSFRGNGGTFGVQAETQIMTAILAPNASDPRRVDYALVGGLVGFRRLRSDVRWTLFRRDAFDETGQSAESNIAPLDPAETDPARVPWLRSFCTDPLPEVETIRVGDETQFALPTGPVGLANSVTCIYGDLCRDAGPARREGGERVAEFGCNLATPAQALHMDLLVSEELGFGPPTVTLHGRMGQGSNAPVSKRNGTALPFTETITDLGLGLEGLTTPLLPQYLDIVAHALDRAGWTPSGFRGWRFSMAYPPIPALAMMSCELPE